MASASLSAGYGPAVRVTILWAAITSIWALVLALPFGFLGLGLVVEGLIVTGSIGEAGSGVLVSILVGLFLRGVLGSIGRSVARVWKSPGYPERHWWFVRRAFRGLFLLEAALLAAGVGLTAFTTFGHGRLADLAGPVAALTLGGFLFAPLLILLGLNGVLRHAAVVPYFPRRVGEISTFSHGESLARHVAELDGMAASLGVTPLSSFGWNDDIERESLVWHPASEGLKTVNALLASLEGEVLKWDDHDGTVDDLKRLSQALARAEAQDIPFSLLLRHATATNAQEWAVRKGTCF